MGDQAPAHTSPNTRSRFFASRPSFRYASGTMRRFRELSIYLVVLGLGGSAVVVRAEDDGPGPVDSEESLTAGRDDMAGPQAQQDKDKEAVGNPTGTYTGVHPGGAEAPAVPATAGQQPAMVTWPGFQMRLDGTSRVFVQSTASVPSETTLTGNKFTLRLSGAKVAGDTNRLPLETRYFNTPVTRVSIAQQRDSVLITLDLRAQVVPQASAERGPSGFFFTYIDLPAGKFVETAKPLTAARAGEVALPPASPDADPDHLDGEVDATGRVTSGAKAKAKANVRVDTSMDNELPPSIKASSKTKAGVKLGN